LFSSYFPSSTTSLSPPLSSSSPSNYTSPSLSYPSTSSYMLSSSTSTPVSIKTPGSLYSTPISSSSISASNYPSTALVNDINRNVKNINNNGILEESVGRKDSSRLTKNTYNNFYFDNNKEDYYNNYYYSTGKCSDVINSCTRFYFVFIL
jgi:hypothetical protein